MLLVAKPPANSKYSRRDKIFSVRVVAAIRINSDAIFGLSAGGFALRSMADDSPADSLDFTVVNEQPGRTTVVVHVQVLMRGIYGTAH